jgi:hypothetical protein
MFMQFKKREFGFFLPLHICCLAIEAASKEAWIAE